jgi:hypothetical protein
MPRRKQQMCDSADSKVLSLWSELCQEVTSLQKDVEKNALKSNVSAGVRVRKGLREIRKQAALLLKESLGTDKAVVDQRKVKNGDKKGATN